MNALAGIGKTYRIKLSKVLERNYGVITPLLVSETLKVSTQEAGRLLSRWCNNGWLSRIKRGAYISVPLYSTSSNTILKEPYLVAESIFGPGYIAGFSAVKHWDFSEQIIESVTFFTIKKVKNRNPTYGGVKFKIKTITSQKLFGLKTLWFGNQKVKISDPTKTMIDLLDDPKIVGGIRIVCDFFAEYLDSEHYNIELLIKYALKMNNRTILKRLGLLYETKFETSKENLELICNNISTGLSYFDPMIPSECNISKWQLKTSKYWKKKYDTKK